MTGQSLSLCKEIEIDFVRIAFTSGAIERTKAIVHLSLKGMKAKD